MPDPCSIRFNDYYEAHLVAHQLEEEGHRAAVYDYTLSLAPWPSGGFRLVVFEDGQTGEPRADGSDPEFGEFESGRWARCLDAVLRYLTITGIAMTPILAISFIAGLRVPYFEAQTIIVALIVLAFSIVVLTCAAAITIVIYDGYRQDDPLCIALMQIGGGVAFLCHPGLLAVFVAIPLIFGFPNEPRATGGDLEAADEDDPDG